MRQIRIVLLAFLISTAALTFSGAALADVYVMVDDGTAYQLDSKDQETWTARPETNVVGAAFDGVGRLWLSQQPYEDGDCFLASPSLPGVTVAPEDLVYPGGTRMKNVDLCWINSAPGQTLLTIGSAHTLGSMVLWQLDLTTLSVRRLMPGYSGAVGPSGQLAAIRHVYFGMPRAGSWEALMQGSLARPGAARVIVRAPRARSRDPQVWEGPSYSADGRLAVSRDGRAVVGSPGRWAAVGPRGQGVGITAWDSTGDLYLVAAYPEARLYRVPGGQPGPTELWINGDAITAFAIGPDSPGAPVMAPSTP